MSDAALHLIDPAADRALQVRRILEELVARHCAQHGDNLAGFTLVTWDMRGCPTSGRMTAVGPIDRCLAPTFTADVLNRHLAVELAEETATDRVTT